VLHPFRFFLRKGWETDELQVTDLPFANGVNFHFAPATEPLGGSSDF